MKLKKLLKVISSSPNSETLVEIFNEYRLLLFCNSVEELQKKAGGPIMKCRVTKFFPIESQYLPKNDHFGSGLIILVEADRGNHEQDRKAD